MTANLPGLVQALQFRKGGGVKLVLINSGEYIYFDLSGTGIHISHNPRLITLIITQCNVIRHFGKKNVVRYQ
jgi:hypothetical protein